MNGKHNIVHLLASFHAVLPFNADYKFFSFLRVPVVVHDTCLFLEKYLYTDTEVLCDQDMCRWCDVQHRMVHHGLAQSSLVRVLDRATCRRRASIHISS